MTVWVDKHEKNDMRALVDAATEESRETDDFGADYVAGGFAIERKRWAEVAGRMTEQDRHLFYQVDKLVDVAEALGLTPALLLEGEIGSHLTHSRVSPDRIAQYLAGLPVMGVTVIPSTGRKCSAKILGRLESGEEPDVRRVRGTADDPGEEPRFLVEGLPGVGTGRAEDLLEHFGDARSVFVASEEELMEVSGIGPATAESISGALERAHDGQ